MTTKKRKPRAAKPTDAEYLRAEAAMKEAMYDAVTRDLCKHATEQCIRSVHGTQALADLHAGRMLIALECAAAILLYESARLKHAGKLEIPLAEVLNQLTHDMLFMISPERISSGEMMLMDAAKRDA